MENCLLFCRHGDEMVIRSRCLNKVTKIAKSHGKERKGFVTLWMEEERTLSVRELRARFQSTSQLELKSPTNNSATKTTSFISKKSVLQNFIEETEQSNIDDSAAKASCNSLPEIKPEISDNSLTKCDLLVKEIIDSEKSYLNDLRILKQVIVYLSS